VAVLHHGLRQQPVGLAQNHVHGNAELIRDLAAAGLHLVLSGHNHYPHVEVVEGAPHGSFVWSQAGTATSNRLRYAGCRYNSFSLVQSDAHRLEIEWWRFDEERGAFARGERHGFERRGRAMHRIAKPHSEA
jgi:hypothetical protein